METWKDIPGYENLYQASNLGQIKSLAKKIPVNNHGKKTVHSFPEKILKPEITWNNRLRVVLSKNKVHKRWSVHKLIALTFIPEDPKRPHINHKDGNPQNNKVENLERCTRSENEQHALKTGLRKSGADHAVSKLTWEQVKDLRFKYSSGNYTQNELGKLFNIKQTTVSSIVLYKTYKKGAG